jgi:large-conductance mechanosensitive channel
MPKINLNNPKTLKTFIIKYSIIASVFNLVLANIYNEYVNKFINFIVSPLFNLDLNNNGEPDFEELKNYTININNRKIHLGLFIFNLITLSIKLGILYFVLTRLLKYLKL